MSTKMLTFVTTDKKMPEKRGAGERVGDFDEIYDEFDVASAVFARLERGEASHFGATRSEMLDRFTGILAMLGDRVPEDVELL